MATIDCKIGNVLLSKFYIPYLTDNSQNLRSGGGDLARSTSNCQWYATKGQNFEDFDENKMTCLGKT